MSEHPISGGIVLSFMLFGLFVLFMIISARRVLSGNLTGTIAPMLGALIVTAGMIGAAELLLAGVCAGAMLGMGLLIYFQIPSTD